MNNSSFDPPRPGVVFWPVGNGDSTTILLDEDTVVQVDLNNLEAADTDIDDREHVLDRLVERLPVVNERPYLAAFILTHPDIDHCRGFEELLERVTIGELWATPRLLDESDELDGDARAFENEVLDRVKECAADGGVQKDGRRVRLVGFESDVVGKAYADLPDEFRTAPGEQVTSLDGLQRDDLRIFVHAPFKDDLDDGERNDTSLAMQVTLHGESEDLRMLLLGDLAYPTIDRLLERSDLEDLRWDVLLAAHHCSHRAFVEDDGDVHEDLAERLAETMEQGARVVASCKNFGHGDGPPHDDARTFYEGIVGSDNFLATCEHKGPIAFSPDEGLVRAESAGAARSSALKGAAREVARSTGSTPSSKRVYG